MSKFLLTILLLFATCSVVAHAILAYQYNTVQSLISKEEMPDEKSKDKEDKDYGKEKIFSFLNTHKHSFSQNRQQLVSGKAPYCSDGFAEKPYTPPEVL